MSERDHHLLMIDIQVAFRIPLNTQKVVLLCIMRKIKEQDTQLNEILKLLVKLHRECQLIIKHDGNIFHGEF